MAIGVSACDVDGDGNEEVFILNTDAYSGPTTKTSVRLFKRNVTTGTYTDLFTLKRNQGARAYAAGRSVACLDRDQDGRYGAAFSRSGYGTSERECLCQQYILYHGVIAPPVT